MKRREFVGLVGGAAAWPLIASAQQQGKIVRIGILADEPWPPIESFRKALHDLGYIEGKNVRFEYRYAKGDNKRLPELANNLVGLDVDVILTWGTDAVLAAKQATTTIPIVMSIIGDPLGAGIVTNLAHPGGNVTGCSLHSAEPDFTAAEPPAQGLTISLTSRSFLERTAVSEITRRAPALDACCGMRPRSV